MAHNDFVAHCPLCGHDMIVTRLGCPQCGSSLEGKLTLPALARLPRELQDVAVVFLACRGNFREVEKELGVSYPTVSKKLDAVNLFLKALGAKEDSPKSRILRQVEAGELDVKAAIGLLKQQETG